MNAKEFKIFLEENKVSEKLSDAGAARLFWLVLGALRIAEVENLLLQYLAENIKETLDKQDEKSN